MIILFTTFLACADKTSDTSAGSDTETSTENQENNIECARFNEEECLNSNMCSPIMGAPISYDEENTCWLQEDMVFTECMSIDMGCGQGIIHA